MNEFFMTDFDKNSADDGLFYHFYSDIDDLLNSLKVGAIYSNKNAFRAQYDAKAAANDASYVCFTTQREGKQRAAMNFCGPYGIAFRNLESFAKRKEHILFSPDEAYIGEVPMLNRYRVSADGKVHKKLDPKRDDFQLSAIGKMKIDGKIAYFVSGGRGRNLGGKHLSSKLLYSDADENGVPGPNDKLYKTLWDWFDKGSRSDRGMMYYRFEGLQGNDLGKPTQLFVGKNGKSYPVNVENQNNENYVP